MDKRAVISEARTHTRCIPPTSATRSAPLIRQASMADQNRATGTGPLHRVGLHLQRVGQHTTVVGPIQRGLHCLATTSSGSVRDAASRTTPRVPCARWNRAGHAQEAAADRRWGGQAWEVPGVVGVEPTECAYLRCVQDSGKHTSAVADRVIGSSRSAGNKSTWRILVPVLASVVSAAGVPVDLLSQHLSPGYADVVLFVGPGCGRSWCSPATCRSLRSGGWPPLMTTEP